MKHKYISIQSNQLLTYFNRKNRNYFFYREAFGVLHDSKESTVRELLSDMTRRGLLMRLKPEVYYIVPYEQDASTFMPDWHLIPEAVLSGTEHYIGYYSALQIHNLITQPSLKEQVVVARQIRPAVLVIKAVIFQFVYHNPSHFFGYKKVWIDDFHKVFCSDLEKTMIDCLFKPGYAGGIVEVARAIYTSRATLNFPRLLEYSRKFGSQAVIKRLGFLLELLDIRNTISEELSRIRTASVVPLDPELGKEGKINSRWSMLINLDTETIKSAIYT
jgi:predicted transcriptional regulator of viral defense system